MQGQGLIVLYTESDFLVLYSLLSILKLIMHILRIDSRIPGTCPVSSDQEMDGEAIVNAFGICSGPDCLKDIVPKYGQRIKVYNAIRGTLGEAFCQKVSSSFKYTSVLLRYIKLLCICIICYRINFLHLLHLHFYDTESHHLMSVHPHLCSWYIPIIFIYLYAVDGFMVKSLVLHAECQCYGH